MRALKRVVLVVAGLYLALCMLVFAVQRSLIYQPSQEYRSPASLGLQNVDEVQLKMAGGESLISWYAPASGDRPTLLMFHGNGGALHHRAARVRLLTNAGYGVFLLGYPGYGGNAGDPSEANFVAAAGLAYDFLQQQHVSAANLVIYGTSLGSAVAVQLSAREDAAALILEAPMSSVRDIAASLYPIFPVSLLLRDPFLSREHIQQVDERLLIIHGDADRVIPLASGRRLFDAANDPKEMHVIAGGGHNDLLNHGLHTLVQDFLERS